MIQGARPIRPRAPVESNRLRINTTGWRSINERPPPARFRYGRALMTEPMWRKGRHLDAVQARILHGMATKLDGLPGEFPPDDTGSSGLGAAKAAKALGTSPPPRLWLGDALAALARHRRHRLAHRVRRAGQRTDCHGLDVEGSSSTSTTAGARLGACGHLQPDLPGLRPGAQERRRLRGPGREVITDRQHDVWMERAACREQRPQPLLPEPRRAHRASEGGSRRSNRGRRRRWWGGT
jgi:hypothetical protein